MKADRARLQDLASAVLSGQDVEDVLTLLVHAAHTDLRADTAVLVLPAGDGSWSIEIAEGVRAEEWLGITYAAGTPVADALGTHSAPGIDSITGRDVLGPGVAPAAHLLALVDGGFAGGQGLLLVRSLDGAALAGDGPRERLDALAVLAGLALAGPPAAAVEQAADERRRIARDLHDLAIQELFAVGMELESLHQEFSRNGGESTRYARRMESSVRGIESAVTQIRQIVQSLRRERSQATLAERLRHEVGIATAGLGFVPSLRLPEHPATLDQELPEDIVEDVVAVVRECLANASRHAQASAVAVSLSVIDEGVDRVVQVHVSDNGRGIDPSVSRRSGLANISSRARRHSGWVDAFALDPGTMIAWRVTLPAE